MRGVLLRDKGRAVGFAGIICVPGCHLDFFSRTVVAGHIVLTVGYLAGNTLIGMVHFFRFHYFLRTSSLYVDIL